MKRLNKKTVVIIGAVLALVSAGVWATSARVAWTPHRFAPASLAPGETVTVPFFFTNRGPSAINSKKLAFRIEGDANRLITIGSVTFPKTIKREDMITVPLTITVPPNEPMGVVYGELLLLDTKPDDDGRVKKIFSERLPIEITVSTIPLPPDPGEEGKATVLGVVTNQYNIRDDVLRAIVFNHPDSEPIRNALIQYAQADQNMAADYLALSGNPAEQKRVVRLDAKERGAAADCMSHVSGVNDIPLGQGRLDERIAIRAETTRARKAIDLIFRNTDARIRIAVKTNALLGGTTSKSPDAAEAEAACDTNLFD